jgi:hypothetical protein
MKTILNLFKPEDFYLIMHKSEYYHSIKVDAPFSLAGITLINKSMQTAKLN